MNKKHIILLLLVILIPAVVYGAGYITRVTPPGLFANISEECTLPGDVNHDGKLTQADIDCINDRVLSKPTPDCPTLELCGDLDGDDVIGGSDVNALTDIIRGNQICGDGICGLGEIFRKCPQDCPCSTDRQCARNKACHNGS